MTRIVLSLAALVALVTIANAAQLRLVVVPNPADIVSTAPIGTVVANISASWNNGRPFTGIVTVTTPNTPFGVVGNKFLTVFYPEQLSALAGQTLNLDIQATQ